jgi:DNA repair exonuclease SbcCD ATPase subunit
VVCMTTSLLLSLTNFKSWGYLKQLEMDGYIELLGENLIDDGSNGSGKTSILQALYFVVYYCKNNKFPDNAKNYIKNGAREFKIIVDLTLDGVEYSVKLSYTSKGEVHFEPDDAKSVNYLAGLAYSFFLPVFSNFASKDPKQRKAAILADLDCESLVSKCCEKIDAIKIETISLLNDKSSEINDTSGKISTLMATYSAKGGAYSLSLKDLSFRGDATEEEDEDLQSLYDKIKVVCMGNDDALQYQLAVLQKKRQDTESSAQDLYNRTSAGKIAGFVKSKAKEYNDDLAKKYDESVLAAEKLKSKEKLELEEEIKAIEQKIKTKGTEKLSVQQIGEIQMEFDALLSDCHEISVNDLIVKAEKLVKNIKDILATEKYKLTGELDSLQNKLRKLKKPATKKPTQVKVETYTPKSKPKTVRKLAQYYVLYDFSNGEKHLIEKSISGIIPETELDEFFNTMPEYQSPPGLVDLDIAIKNIQETLTQRNIQPVNNQNQKEQLWDRISAIASKKFCDMTNKINDITKESAVLKEKISQLDSLYSEIKNNFPNYLCSVVTDYLRNITEEYKKQFFNPLTSLEFSFEDRKPFSLLDGRQYPLLSEGEKSKISLIFNLAYRDLLNYQHQVESDRLLCDEIFDGMDDLSRAQAVSLLSSKEIANNVLIVSHTERGLTGFRQMNVQKDTDGSKLKKQDSFT